jgi:DNA-binding NarL/FixJ family response regulator
MHLRLLIVEDEALTRDGYVAAITHRGHFASVASAADGYEALQAVRRQPPDVVLMDVLMPGLNGIETTRQILAECPSVKIIALSGHDDRTLVVEMLRAGARGYALKAEPYETLLHAINEVVAGRIYLSPQLTGVVVEHLLDDEKAIESDDTLTPRERELLQWLAQGRSPREIAHRLCIDRKTVEAHRRHIMGKLGLKTQADLVKYAIRIGIISVK